MLLLMMKCRMIGLLGFFGLLSAGLAAQTEKPAETESEFEKNYARRIQQEMINGVYIPRDLVDAFSQLNQLIDAESKRKFRSVEEEVAVSKLFFSLGRWITRNWGFYEGSRLSHYFRKMGVFHPEDMARMLIVSYHRYLNDTDLDLKGQIRFYQKKQEAERREYLEESEILYRDTRKVDPETLKKKGEG